MRMSYLTVLLADFNFGLETLLGYSITYQSIYENIPLGFNV